ncbi:MAG: ABC transporter ATP-binding protein [Thermoanaerobaculaceae bacterium]|jgi:ABC-type multidrug transport system ATPase subunit|nr:ABC transporter ATP-binding protein [Thermoanaerobaculaceae bacterium]
MQLSLQHLTKRYPGGKLGLSDFSAEIGPGVLGLLGPNGAGKSTLMRILATITRPTSGRVLADGTDIGSQPDAVRNVLGYLPQDFGVYGNLTAVEFLAYIAALKGLGGKGTRQRIETLLDEMNLATVRGNPISSFSGGMRQRIGIAQALLNDPRLLILDEPTVGLDPQERVRFRNLLAHLAGERIVILSSHIVSDIETIADEIVVMHEGRLLARGTAATLRQAAEGRTFECVVGTARLDDLKGRHIVSRVSRHNGDWQVRYLLRNGVAAEPASTPVDATLEDAYLVLTGGGAA